MLRRWSLYLNRYVAALDLESLEAPGCHAPLLLKPILSDLEGGSYTGPIIPASLEEILHKTSGRGGGDGGNGDKGSSDGSATSKKRKASPTGGTQGCG